MDPVTAIVLGIISIGLISYLYHPLIIYRR